MANYKQLFINFMDEKNIRYSDLNDHIVRVSYSGNNVNSIPVFVAFDRDGENLVQFHCSEIMSFKGQEAEGIWVCNELNKLYRWVKFYIDDDSDIVMQDDAIVDEATCGDECMRLVLRMVSIIDEAYVQIFKAKHNID